MKESALVKILKYGIYITAFVPLIIFSEFISPFHFGKVIVFRSIIEILFVFYIILIWHNRFYLPHRNSIFWSFFAFTFVFGVTTLTSVDVLSSFWGFLERMGGFWSFLHYFVYFVILTAVFRTKDDWLRLLDVALAVGVLSALYGFGQKLPACPSDNPNCFNSFFVGFGQRERIFGTIGNAALFAGYELLVAFTALTFLFRRGISFNRRAIYGVTFILVTIAILMTAARGSLLGLAIGSFLFLSLYAFIYKSRKAKTAFMSFAFLGVLFIGVSLFAGDSKFIENSRYLRRITDLSFKSYTIQTRFWAWEAGIKGWKESPKTILLGWGPENFNIPFSKHFNPKFYTGPGSETLFDRAHNMFVEVLVTMGIIGLISYSSIFYFSIRSLFRRVNKVAKEEAVYFIGMLSLLVAYMAHNFFFFDTSANFILFFTLLGFINFVVYGTSEVVKSNKKVPGSKTNLTFFLLLIVIFSIYKTNVIPSKANYATPRGIVRSWEGDYAGAVEKFKESIAYNTFGVFEYRHRLAQIIFDKHSQLKNPQYIIDVIKEVEKNAESSQLDYLPHLYLSRLNILLGANDPSSKYNDIALMHARKALELAPTFVRAYYETGQAYLNKKQLDMAAEEFRKAANLNPDIGVSYWYWGMVVAEEGNLDEAALVFEKAFTVTYPYSASTDDLLRLARFYSEVNNFKMLAVIYESAAGPNGSNPQYHATLAYVYAKLGRIDQAVEQARWAARVDSSYEAEAKAFIQALGKSR